MEGDKLILQSFVDLCQELKDTIGDMDNVTDNYLGPIKEQLLAMRWECTAGVIMIEKRQGK
jgi:hypothetical protein